MRRCQDELVGPEKYAEYVRRLERGELPLPRVSKKKDADALTDDEVLSRCQEIARVFATVEGMLRGENLGTFGHMITGAYDLLQDSEQLKAAQAHSRFILVDEFQDANYAQVKILRLLAGEQRNVFAVGDPDQAIYQFRGASSAAFGLFQRHFPGTQVVKLEKNRRSTTAILRSAFAVIDKNPEAFAGEGLPSSRRAPLVSARDEDVVREGNRPESLPVEAVISIGKEVESMDAVAAIRQRRRESRCKWEQIAVLYRLHTHRDRVAEELAAQGIPFSIENMDVMDAPEVRDLFACIGAIVSERDSASLFRVAALPQFTIDPNRLRAGIQGAAQRLPAKCWYRNGAWTDRRRTSGARRSKASPRRDDQGQRKEPRRRRNHCAALRVRFHVASSAGGARVHSRMGGEGDYQDERASRASGISGVLS